MGADPRIIVRGEVGEGASGTEPGFESVVFGAHGVGAVDALEPADREMAARQILEMLGESKVEGSPAHGTDDHHGLRHHLLGHDDAEPRGDLCYEPDDSRRTLTHHTLVEREIGDFDDTMAVLECLELVITVDLTWKDLRTGKILLQRRGLQQDATFHPPLGEGEFVGAQQAIERVALVIVQEMQADW